jgi:hypothetical protein
MTLIITNNLCVYLQTKLYTIYDSYNKQIIQYLWFILKSIEMSNKLYVYVAKNNIKNIMRNLKFMSILS